MRNTPPNYGNLQKSLNDDQTPTTINTVILEDGKLVLGKLAANELAKLYVGIGKISVTKEIDSNVRAKIKHVYRKARNLAAMQDEISHHELSRSIHTLKTEKPPDQIMNEMIKHFGPKARITLLHIFNCSWKQGEVPTLWKKSTIIRILKKRKDKQNLKTTDP